MKTFKNMICIAVTLITLAMSLSGCHTVEGMGKDIESGGEKIQDVAD